MNNIIEIVILCSKIKSKSKKHIKTEMTDNEIIKNENKYINDDLLFGEINISWITTDLLVLIYLYSCNYKN